MNKPITLTPSDLITMFLAICVGITTISAAVTVIVKLIQKAKQPNQTQNDRIEALEKKVKEFENYFNNDNKRLDELEEGNRVTQQALLALLSHSINGNDTDKLTKARDDLQDYLISKGGVHDAK